MNAQPIHFKPSEGFRARSKAVVDNPFLRQSFRGAMDFLMSKHAAQFPDAEELESPIPQFLSVVIRQILNIVE